jgi:hypothetical protein
MAFFVATSLAPYGGDDGLTWPTRTLVLGTRVLKNETAFFYASLAVLAVTYLLVGRLVASRFGRVLRGLTDNEMRMQAIGFTPFAYRLTAYLIAGSMCGLAGFLLANQTEFVSPAYMHWQRSGELIVMVLLGGTGTLYGPILGAAAFLMLEETLSRLTEHWKVVLGPRCVLMVLFARAGSRARSTGWRQRRGARPGCERARSVRPSPPRRRPGAFAELAPPQTASAHVGRRSALTGWPPERPPAGGGQTALRRGLQGSARVAPRGLRASICRWWQR